MKKANVVISECEIALSNCVQLEDYNQDNILKLYDAYLKKYMFQNIAILHIIQDIVLKPDEKYDYNILFERFIPFVQNLNKYLDLNWDEKIINLINYYMLLVTLTKQDRLYEYLYCTEEGYSAVNNIISIMKSIQWYDNKNSSYGISLFTMLTMIYGLYCDYFDEAQYYIENSDKIAIFLKELKKLISLYVI